MAAAMRRQLVDVPAMNRSVDTAFVGPDSWPTEPAGMAFAHVKLHVSS